MHIKDSLRGEDAFRKGVANPDDNVVGEKALRCAPFQFRGELGVEV